MTQGKEFLKCSLECDIIDPTDTNTSSYHTTIPRDGILTTTIQRGQPIAGTVVGAIQIVCSHARKVKPGSPVVTKQSVTKKDEIKGRTYNKLSDGYLTNQGINWRAHDDPHASHIGTLYSYTHTHAYIYSLSRIYIPYSYTHPIHIYPTHIHTLTHSLPLSYIGTQYPSNRPKTRVRAVPLSESAPELSKVLNEHHQNTLNLYKNQNIVPLSLSRRSLSTTR